MLRGEPGSITLQQRMPSGYMEPLHTLLQLEMKVISHTCANMHGMNGVTSENKQQPFPTTKKFWEECLAQQEEQEMRWPSGYLKQWQSSTQEIIKAIES